MSAQPPSYEAAIQDQPGSSSKQHTQQQPQQPVGSDKEQFHALADQLAEEMDSTDESDVDDQGRRKPRRKPTAEEIEERMSMDDEMRELPEGWERCFDQKVRQAITERIFDLAHSKCKLPHHIGETVWPSILCRHPCQTASIDLDPPLR